MRGEAQRHTLQATALVHEAYMKLQRVPMVDWANRTHFFATAARTMRQVLVDHARTAKRVKRGGGWKQQELNADCAVAEGGQSYDLLALNEALERLTEMEPRKGQVVELRYFAGFTGPETVDALGVTTRTVERDWQYAQAWLARELI